MDNKKKGLVTEQVSEQYERCVLCGRCTDVPVDLEIERRTGYVEGCGQLCSKCFAKLMGSQWPDR